MDSLYIILFCICILVFDLVNWIYYFVYKKLNSELDYPLFSSIYFRGWAPVFFGVLFVGFYGYVNKDDFSSISQSGGMDLFLLVSLLILFAYIFFARPRIIVQYMKKRRNCNNSKL